MNVTSDVYCELAANASGNGATCTNGCSDTGETSARRRLAPPPAGPTPTIASRITVVGLARLHLKTPIRMLSVCVSRTLSNFASILGRQPRESQSLALAGGADRHLGEPLARCADLCLAPVLAPVGHLVPPARPGPALTTGAAAFDFHAALPGVTSCAGSADVTCTDTGSTGGNLFYTATCISSIAPTIAPGSTGILVTLHPSVGCPARP